MDELIENIEKKGWGILTNILSKDEVKSINDFFIKHRDEFGPALVGHKTEKKRVEAIRGDFTYWIDPLHSPLEFRHIIFLLNELKQKINQRLFLGLKDFECHLAYYPPGSFYKKHLDQFEKDSSRSLSFIFYLNEGWNTEDKGELILYNKKGEELTRVSPRAGTLACFLSADFPHEVNSATKERRSMTGWMHTKLLY